LWIIGNKPNPSTTNAVTISASERIEYISIVNQLGQVVYVNEFESAQNAVEVNGDFLTEGIYIVTVRFVDSSVYTDKLIVR